MEFLEALLLKHQKYYKQNKIGDHLKLRTQSFKTEYKHKLFLKMDETRNLEALTPVRDTPINAKEKSNGRIDRLTKLKMWKQEKEKQKQQKVSKKPVFIVAAAKNVGFPALKTEGKSFAPKNHVFKPPKDLTVPPMKPGLKTSQRVTRAQKPVASPPLPLPPRKRKKTAGDEKEDTKSPKTPKNAIKVKREKLQRQNAVEPEENMMENDIATREPDTRVALKNITPENKGPYISPYVTTSRGKCSVRKENRNRSLRGFPSFSESSPADVGAAHFYKVLNNEISRLENLCKVWTEYKDENKVLSDDAIDLIDVAVGQAQLLMNKKFKQFEGLIKACETGTGTEKAVTCEDLQGFWDMVFIQVINLNTRFQRLTTMRDNNWEELVQDAKPKIVQKRVQPKRNNKSVASSGIRAAILAARKKNLAVPQEHITEKKDDESVFDGGFFVIRTPSKDTPNRSMTKATPRSILKSSKKRTDPNLNKSVLFKEDGESAEQDTTSDKKSPPKERRYPRRSTVKQVLF